MKEIWYLLKCPEGSETDYTKECQRLVELKEEVLHEVICFQYQRMLRYGGQWHLERKTLLPGYIFLSGTKALKQRYDEGRLCQKNAHIGSEEINISLIPCSRPFIKNICPKGEVVAMSKGIIWNGKVIVTGGPLKGQEERIRWVDRHKRTARIEIPFEGQNTEVTVGLEIYEKH